MSQTLYPGLLDLRASAPGTIKEGESVRLTCTSNCTGARQSFAWFKDGGPVRGGDELVLTSASPSDSGNYTCSLSNHPGTTSAVVRVDVECEHVKQNHSIHGPKVSPKTDGEKNLFFQTAPRTRRPTRRWLWTAAQVSPWSATALQTPPFRVMSGLESRTGSTRWETSLCCALGRTESISAEPQISTGARTRLSPRSISKVCERRPETQGRDSRGNSSRARHYASNVTTEYVHTYETELDNIDNTVKTCFSPPAWSPNFCWLHRKLALHDLHMDPSCCATGCDHHCCRREVRFITVVVLLCLKENLKTKNS